MLREHPAPRHVHRASDKVCSAATKPAHSHMGIRPKAVAHALPTAKVTALPLSRDQLRNRGDVCTIHNFLLPRRVHSVLLDSETAELSHDSCPQLARSRANGNLGASPVIPSLRTL